jgi:nickel-dependent lactate racemase
MTCRLAYGRAGLEITVPDTAAVTVVEPVFVPAIPDQEAAVAESLGRPIGSLPLRERVAPIDTVAVVFSDLTRPTPNAVLVPAVLAELAAAGIPPDRITLFNSTGTHRPNTRPELAGMLGEDVVSRYRIVQNDARADGRHAPVGTTASGNEIHILKDFLACSFKILTGFIEPHFFAGFSGGGKAIMPGLARLDTVMRNHDARTMDDPRSTWAVLDGNPVRAEVEETVAFVRPDFLVNVALNRDKRITAVFSGDVTAAYRAGTEFVRKTAMVEVASPFDIVVTSNSGYPLDLNLYQAVKGMSAAARIVRPGGSIVVAAECWDGIPEHGSFGRLLREAKDVDELLARIRTPGFAMDDQWQAQILALIVKKADVYVHADGLTPRQIETAKLRPCPSIDEQVALLLRRYGPRARVCVLPEGPQTVPYCPSGGPPHRPSGGPPHHPSGGPPHHPSGGPPHRPSGGPPLTRAGTPRQPSGRGTTPAAPRTGRSPGTSPAPREC